MCKGSGTRTQAALETVKEFYMVKEEGGSNWT